MAAWRAGSERVASVSSQVSPPFMTVIRYSPIAASNTSSFPATTYTGEVCAPRCTGHRCQALCSLTHRAASQPLPGTSTCVDILSMRVPAGAVSCATTLPLNTISNL